MKHIRPKRYDPRNLKLSAEEGFVLSRVDGTTTVKDLVALTGLDESRVVDIIGRLQAEGAVDVDAGAPDATPSSSRGFAAAPSSSRTAAVSTPASPASRAASPSPSGGEPRRPAVRLDESPEVEAELLAFLRGEDAPEPAADAKVEASGAEPAEAPPAEGERSGEAPASDTDATATDVASADTGASEPAGADGDVEASASEDASSTESKPDAVDEAEEAEVVAQEQRNERAYRQIYETVYHPMSRDARLKAAQEVTGADLLALCLDADPQVIHAVLTNSRAGLEHARMIALHHRTQIGLEAVAKRNELLKDALVQRRLLRNPQLPGTILARMVTPKLILEVYKICIDREIPERSRVMTREILRKKFMLASSDEKASLLVKTEGRCLILLVNCSLDAHATQILCGKQTFSLLFIQNLARWSATPPALLAHLLKLPVVRRNTGLKKMLLKHPNMPSDVKRKI